MVFFSFSSYIYLLYSEQDFFSFSPTQEVIRVKIAYVGFVVVAIGGRGLCRGLGSSV